ncbi:MAG: hypothetical protein H6622_17750 [Halobacteriovoraceae bacterium]|nr:hypothetical protein [Halobacteriovoraceae bacterium]
MFSKIIQISLIILSFSMFFLSYKIYHNYGYLEHSGIVTKAFVKSINTKINKSDTDKNENVVEFKYQSNTIRVPIESKKLNPGEMIDIVFDPQDLENVQLADKIKDQSSYVFITGLCGCFFLILIFFVRKYMS